ncbi:aryl-alcohol dehydrogenase [NADP(+)] [Earliella scabrosa]|nr:aryl-alcohol dehydrogenase [NADP(+)] [Earliella scabrosa]
MAFPFPPPPKTKLGRHRQLCPLAGVHVSPIVLGAMSIGDKQLEVFGMGTMDKEASFKLLDTYHDEGGNFIDTASNYQEETSEMFLGNRHCDEGTFKTHYVGNNAKSLHISAENSLKKLRTSYIDTLYIHWWDWTCGVEEVMNSLHHLVASGKVLYFGVSNAPSWIVTKANTYARMAGKTPFVIYQGPWSVVQRDMEREIGMAICPWNVLATGKIRTDAEEEARLKSGSSVRRRTFGADWMRNEKERKVAKVLEEARVGTPSIQAVAIAYVMQMVLYVFPLVGGRKVEHLHANIQALDIAVTEEHIRRIQEASPLELGFPYEYMGTGSTYGIGYVMSGHHDKWPAQQAIRPAKQ